MMASVRCKGFATHFDLSAHGFSQVVFGRGVGFRDLAFARALAADGVGRPVYPLWLVFLGALAVALSTLAALRTLWRSRVPAGDRAAAVLQWRRWRALYAPRLVAASAALVASVVVVAGGVLAVGGIGQSPLPDRAVAPGALWVGTPSGAARLTDGGWSAVRRPWAPLPAAVVHDVAGGPDGAVWLATGGGLLRIGPDGSYVRAIVENAPLPYPTVLGVAVDARGVAWAATVAGAAGVAPDLNGRAFSAKSGLLMHSLLDAAHVDRRGLVWFGGAGGVNVYEPPSDWSLPGRWPTGFNRWSTGGGLPENLVFAIHEDRAGRMWFGTDGGAAAFTPDPTAYALGSGEPSRWTTYARATSGLAHDKVHAIAEDSSGRLYFGTEAGVSILEPGPGGAPRWSAIAPQQLPHPHVEALAVSPDNRLWIGTKDGLAVYDPNRPAADLPVFRSHPLRRWTGLLWPPHSHQTLPATEITALAWLP
jgi:hypothetical protein